jgi:hypothetical protein
VSGVDEGDLLLRAPGVGQVASVVEAVRRGAVGEAVQQCLEFGQGGYGLARGDPLEVLIGAGLSWMLGVVQPVEDQLAKVTGNVDRARREAERWRGVAGELLESGDAVRSVVERELAGWSGAAAGRAAVRLRDFADGLEGAAGEVQELRGVLIASAGMFEAARGLVVEILSALVEWAVVTWLVAEAAAVASFGASLSFAVAQLETEAALATERAGTVAVRVELAVIRIERALAELINDVALRLPRAATELVVRPASELAGRVPGIAAAAVGQEAAALLDGSFAGLEGYGHLSQSKLLPAQPDPDRHLTRMR